MRQCRLPICGIRPAITLLALSGYQSGCGQAPAAKEPVSGIVLLDGELMEEGSIYFKKIQEGALDRMDIRRGKFSGAVGRGEFRVEVSHLQEGKPFHMGDEQIPNRINIVDPQFNSHSTLSARVANGCCNQFIFEVTSKAPEPSQPADRRTTEELPPRPFRPPPPEPQVENVIDSKPNR